jgi:hypothetical protein
MSAWCLGWSRQKSRTPYRHAVWKGDHVKNVRVANTFRLEWYNIGIVTGFLTSSAINLLRIVTIEFGNDVQFSAAEPRGQDLVDQHVRRFYANC